MGRFHMLALALAGAIALAAAPGAAQERNAYEAGVAARQAGHPAEARRLLGQWLAAHPDDLDAHLQLAYVDLALGNLEAAEAGFAAVLAEAPDYRDARDGLGLVAARRQGSVAQGRGFVALDSGLSDLSAGVRDWSEVALDIEIPAGERITVGAHAGHYRRFGLTDVELGGRIGLHPSDNLWLRAHLGGTPKADFRPEIEVGGGFDLRLASARETVLTFDAAYQRFPLQDVVTVNPGLARYLPGGRAWITLRGIGTIADGGPLQVGGLLRGDYVPADRWRLFVGAANGPDTDLGIVTRVTSLFGGLEAPLGKPFALTGSLSREWRDAGIDRTEMRLGLKARF
ncbi:hypothetical protein GCM10011515_00570 [Tsuneonella deserti]|uniref:Tetratricopeptide repeat protein n=1 Tax=Tsuneonella deserti TaxID=2035528 RepID=A0ABQ1RZ43_9SPHN|nr:YaiO family outer membrane beta-barrel protein [Tsuneonella deserti]GGD84742.1 hypothetical protein GCM10011515_00570 [Tsuneonella deserti]